MYLQPVQVFLVSRIQVALPQRRHREPEKQSNLI
jgi:hypothetical protein